MIESSDSNRSRTASQRAARSEGERSGMQRDDRRNTNRQRGSVWAMSVLGNAKSRSHRKTYEVEPDGAARKFTHLTRGDLLRESGRGVSRGRSSKENRRKPEGAKGQRTKRQANRQTPANERGANRNELGAATAATTWFDGERTLGGFPGGNRRDGRVRSRAKGGARRR
jgi:hypothetical protein